MFRFIFYFFLKVENVGIFIHEVAIYLMHLQIFLEISEI